MGRGRGQGGRSQGQGSGLGRMGGRKAAGPDGNCICPNCSHKVPHKVGQPCFDIACPKCGTKMTRE